MATRSCPPLPARNGDLVAIEVHVLHAQLQRLHEPQAGSVQDAGDEALLAAHFCQDRRDFGSRQDDGQAARFGRPRDVARWIDRLPEHFSVQEQDRACGLCLRRRTDLAGFGEVRQERGDGTVVELSRVSLSVIQHVTPDPADVCFFRARTELARTDGGAHLVE